MNTEELAKKLLKALKEENSNLKDGYFDDSRYHTDEVLLLYIALKKFLE